MFDSPGWRAVARWLASPDRPKALHDGKGPMHALRARGVPLRGVVNDTALSAYLVRPDQRSYDLADLVLRHLGRELRIGFGPDRLHLRPVEGHLLRQPDAVGDGGG